MKNKYLLCFVLVCLLLYCYYKPVVEGVNSKDDTERYAFKDESSYQSGGMASKLASEKKTKVETCNREAYKSVTDVKNDTEAANRNPICFKDIKCTDLLKEKQVGCIYHNKGCTGLEVNYIDGKDPRQKRDKKKGFRFEILKKCIKGSKKEHKGIYYLGNINNIYLENLIEGIVGGCYKTLHGDITEAFHYALAKAAGNWKCDDPSNELSIDEKFTCHIFDTLDTIIYTNTASDRAACGLEITKNDTLREL